MALKIRVRLEPGLSRAVVRMSRLAAAAGALLSPAAVMALALGCWRLAADLDLTGQFAISRGLFSHWQVWIGLAVVLQTCASRLSRYGRGGSDAAIP
ncbi:MAG: hypothetical protein FJW34_08260 [Acidobacteria bacterium]|nr:hypothetical protein [Acidobacteriota bacterium]